MKTYLIPALAAMLLLAACKKEAADPDGLVPATQEGKNTGDFLLNGQPWGPQRNITSTGSPVGASWYGSKLGIQISFYRYRSATDDAGLSIFFPLKSSGVFQLAEIVTPNIVPGTGRRCGLYTIYHPSPKRQFLTGPAFVGTVVVTRYDTVAHVVSGTFEAKLREYQGSDSLVITKGRFDCTF